MSAPSRARSWRSVILLLVGAVLLVCLIVVAVSLGVLSIAARRGPALSSLGRGSPPVLSTPAPAGTPLAAAAAQALASPIPTAAVAPPQVLPTTAGPAASAVMPAYPAPVSTAPAASPAAAAQSPGVANPAAATATALAVLGSPIAPGQAAGAAAPAREIGEAQIAQAFANYLSKLGVKPTELNVKLSDKKMHVSARAPEMSLLGLQGFDLAGTFVAQGGKLHFVLQDAPANFPFTNMIAPGIDQIMTGLVGNLYVTQADIQEGKLVVSGRGKS